MTGCAGGPEPDADWTAGVTAVPWKHDELALLSGDSAIPMAIGEAPPFGVCIEAPAESDTSQWQVSLAIGAADLGPGFRPPTTRWGSQLCFEGSVPADLPDGPATLCAELRDGFDRRTAELPCIPFQRRRAETGLVQLTAAKDRLLGARRELGAPEFFASLDELGQRALDEGYPVFHLRIQLIAAYFLRQAGDEESFSAALRRLEEIPAWLDSPAAARWSAMVHYESGTMEMEPGGDLERAWTELEASREAYGKVLDPRRFTPTMKQAEILARAGAVDEAIRRLGDALDSCGEVPCEERLLPAARNTYGWLLLQDSEATAATLEEATALFRAALDTLESEPGGLETANVRINLAYARLRGGADPLPTLQEARGVLRRAPAAERAQRDWLRGWASWIEAQWELRQGNPEAALALCEELAESSPEARLRAWSFSCVADARRLLGELDRAAASIERALVHHELDGNVGLGQDLFLGPGQRADDFYRAARIESERGDAKRAWAVLDRLDRIFAPRRSSDECAELAEAGAVRRAELLRQLDVLDGPAAAPRREQREVIRRRLLERLQEIVRTEATCVGVPGDLGSQARFRAVPLADEVLMLRRGNDGEVSLYRRTPIEYAELVEAVGTVRGEMIRRERADAGWRSALALLSRALAPDDSDLESVTSFTLHGILQQIPLNVLTGPDGTGEPLVRRAAVALHLASSLQRSSRSPDSASVGAGRGLFVIDPTGNLRARASDFVDLRSFPETQVLEGAEATPTAVRAAMRDAQFLHMDAHAQYDPAFPELSTIRLAGGGLDAAAFRADAVALRAANLSACRSGSWPATADSGRYGLAGVLVQSGAPWVVGARTDLDDRFARRFNQAFYAELSRGKAAPEAFRSALDSVRGEFPEPVWSALFLLGAA